MKRFIPVILWLGALTAVAFALLLYEADLLWKVQQYNTFLYSSLYFKQMMVASGGMLSYLGAFFTQFFYHPWMGVLIICSWWLVLMWLTKHTFNIPDRWSVLTLIPVAILLVANMDLGYWHYVLKLRGYFYVATLGATTGTALLWAFRKLPENLWVRLAYIVLVTLVFYPLTGGYALFTVLLMGLWTWRLSANRTQNGALTLVALLSIVLVPLLYYRFVYYETNLTNIYRTAFPVFSIRDDYPLYYIPYYCLAVCYLLLVVTYRKEWKEPPKQKGQKMKPILHWAVQGVLLAAVVGGVWYFWYKDDNFHHELRMKRCVEQADWEGVVAEGRTQKSEPTRAIVMMNNLALSRLGRQCDEMYYFPKGSKKSNTPLPIYMYNVAGRMMFYQYGLLNECHRICMEEGVELGWSIELLQYMARCAVLSGETQAARKFLDLLRQTQYYGEWADHFETLLNSPELLAGDRETGPVTHMLQYDNRLDTADGYVEKFLMTQMANQYSEDPYFQEQAVLAALWTRDSRLFWPQISQYALLHPKGPLPRIFQEAAYLFGNLDQIENLDQMPVDKSVKDSFHAFMNQLRQCQGMPPAQVRSKLYFNFGNTYYFEYYFLRDITYY